MNHLRKQLRRRRPGKLGRHLRTIDDPKVLFGHWIAPATFLKRKFDITPYPCFLDFFALVCSVKLQNNLYSYHIIILYCSPFHFRFAQCCHFDLESPGLRPDSLSPDLSCISPGIQSKSCINFALLSRLVIFLNQVKGKCNSFIKILSTRILIYQKRKSPTLFNFIRGLCPILSMYQKWN